MAFEQAAGFGEFVAHNAEVHEGFAEGFAFEDVGEGGAEGDTGLAGGADADCESLVAGRMVSTISTISSLGKRNGLEVCHDLDHPSTLLSNQMIHRHLHIVKLNECCPRRNLA